MLQITKATALVVKMSDILRELPKGDTETWNKQMLMEKWCL